MRPRSSITTRALVAWLKEKNQGEQCVGNEDVSFERIQHRLVRDDR
jgi:hypothetical protein